MTPGILFTSQGRKPSSTWASSTHLLYCAKRVWMMCAGGAIRKAKAAGPQNRNPGCSLLQPGWTAAELLLPVKPTESLAVLKNHAHLHVIKLSTWLLCCRLRTPQLRENFWTGKSCCCLEGVRRGSGSAAWSKQRRTNGDQRCAGISIPPFGGGKESESPLKSKNMLS